MIDTLTKRAGAMVAAMLILGGCGTPLPIDPLVIPPASDIEYISVHRRKPNGESQHEFKIWDRQRIEEIVTELRLNNTGYSTEMSGRAPQEYSIALSGKGRMMTMIWIGHGWLGGVDQEHEDTGGGLTSHFRKLDAEQHTRLLLLARDLREE